MNVTIKRGDTRTAVKATLKDAQGQAVNLTDCTVRFLMSKKGATTLIVDKGAIIHDAINGVVWYVFDAVDVAESGTMRAEFEVTYPDKRTETFPNSGYITVHIEPDLNREG